MEQLTEMLLSIDFRMTFTFQGFLDNLSNIYEHNPDKRTMIIKIMKELSLISKIRRADVLERALHMLDGKLGQQHMKLFYSSMDMEELYRTIITDPFLTIANHFCENLCPRPNLTLIQNTFFMP